ncbi:MAG: carboxylesterase family protein [Clostridia bacterium]|nr:carboxylesterase family protein [Clostridia bacterium]
MIAFGIVFGILTLLMLAVLELNKNTLLGFFLLALAAAGFAVLFIKVLHGNKWYWKLLGWAGFLGAFALIVLLSWPPIRRVPAYDGNSPVYTDVVSLEKGDVRGVVIDGDAVELYAGIPYAKPPVGDLRWREPQDPDPWDGVLDADHFAPMCMQPTELPIVGSLKQIIGYHEYTFSLSDNYRPAVSEDGLYVNVWKPAGKVEGLPVLVYVHGGTLQTGQPWYGDYAGTGLAREGVVVVNLGYRLGVFGYLADEALAAESPNGTTGNYGLLDQIKALEWVRDNVAAFGGDPNNVTLAGESAGAASVSALCTSPLAKGLFRRVLLESSTVASVAPPHSFRSYEDAIASGKELLARYGVGTVEELRALPAETIVNEAYTQHFMTVDGYALTETPYESYKKGVHNEEAILHGYNSEESGPFLIFGNANLRNYEEKVRGYFGAYADEVLALYHPETDEEAKSYWAQIYGAVFFNYPHYCLNRLAAENGIPVYEYYFSKSNGRLGAWHSGELIYFYGNLPARSRLFDDADYALEKTVVAYLKNYAATGDPNGAGLPAWESDPESARILALGDTVEMTDEKYLAFYEIMDRMTGWNDAR